MWYWLFSTSSWAHCCPSSAGRKSKAWACSAVRAGDLASNHLAVADSFFLPWWCVVASPSWQRPSTSERASRGRLTKVVLHGRRPGAYRPHQRRLRPGPPSTPLSAFSATASCSGCTGGNTVPGRQALQGQERARPRRAGERRPGDPGGDDRNRRRQPAGIEDVAVRPGDGPVRQSRWTSLPVRRHGGQSVFIERAVIDEVMYGS